MGIKLDTLTRVYFKFEFRMSCDRTTSDKSIERDNVIVKIFIEH